MEGVRLRDLGSALESIVQSRCNGGDKCRSADDHDIVNLDRDDNAICFDEITTEEETRIYNLGLETEIVNNEIKDFFIVLLARLLDAIASIIQLDKGSSPAISIRPFAFREAQIKSLIQGTAEEGSGDVQDADLKVVFGCKAETKPNRGQINDLRGDVIIVARLLEIAAADKSYFPFVNCPIGHWLSSHNPAASKHTSTFWDIVNESENFMTFH